MQALGSYKGGKMLFLGLGTGLGSTMIVDGDLEPMELAHLPYKKATLRRLCGTSRIAALWQEEVAQASRGRVEQLQAALEPDDVVLGGGNVKLLKQLPKGCREGNNANAFLGGFRLWADGKRSSSPSAEVQASSAPARKQSSSKKKK